MWRCAHPFVHSATFIPFLETLDPQRTMRIWRKGYLGCAPWRFDHPGHPGGAYAEIIETTLWAVPGITDPASGVSW